MSQSAAILAHLKAGRSLTPLQALTQFHCLRIAARIADLRGAGHRIRTDMVTLPGGKRVARYELDELVT